MATQARATPRLSIMLAGNPLGARPASTIFLRRLTLSSRTTLAKKQSGVGPWDFPAMPLLVTLSLPTKEAIHAILAPTSFSVLRLLPAMRQSSTKAVWVLAAA